MKLEIFPVENRNFGSGWNFLYTLGPIIRSIFENQFPTWSNPQHPKGYHHYFKKVPAAISTSFNGEFLQEYLQSDVPNKLCPATDKFWPIAASTWIKDPFSALFERRFHTDFQPHLSWSPEFITPIGQAEWYCEFQIWTAS